LRHAIEAGKRQSELVRAQKDLLENTWKGTVEALLDVLSIVQPVAFGRGDRLSRMTERWAVDVGVPDPWIVCVACRLLQLGAISVPGPLLERLESGDTLTSDEFNELARMPVTVERILSNIPRLEPIRDILRDLRALSSPDNMGASIIRLALSTDYWMTRGKNMSEALLLVQARQGDAFPSALMIAARQQIQPSGRNLVVKEILLADVRAGMTFVAEVRSPHGLLLAARGQIVTQSILERVHRQWYQFASEQRVFVEVT
jgi:hypothetical protein